MLSETGRRYMLMAPHLAILLYGLVFFLAVVVYGVNMFSGDLLDPRLRGGTGRYGRVG